MSPPRLAALGMVARWKPVHLGHAAVLRGLMAAAPRVVLGIGSANRYDVRSPFTPAETRDMIRLVIGEAPGVDDLRRLDKMAELVGAGRRVLISRTTEPVVSGRRISCNLPWFLKHGLEP